LPQGAVARLGSVYCRHNGPVTAVALLPNGKGLVSFGLDDKLCLWDAATAKLRWKVLTVVQCLAVAPNNQLLATGNCLGDALRLWDVNTGGKVHEIGGKPDQFRALTFSFDSKVLATPDGGTGIALWDVAKGTVLATFGADQGAIQALTFAPTGLVLASGGPDGVVRLWDVSKNHELLRLKGLGEGTDSIAFSHDGTRIAAVDRRGNFVVWDAVTGKRLCMGKGGRTLVQFAADDQSLVMQTGSDVGRWRTATADLMELLTSHIGPVSSVGVSADGKLLITGGRGGAVRLWDLATGKEMTPVSVVEGPAHTVAFTQHGKVIVRGSPTGVDFWEWSTGKRLHQWGRIQPPFALAGRANRLLGLTEAGAVAVYDWEQQAHLPCLLKEPKRPIPSNNKLLVAGSAKGKWLATTGPLYDVAIYDAATGVLLREIKPGAATVSALALSGDGKTLATGSHEGIVRLWDPATGAHLRTLNLPSPVPADRPRAIAALGLSYEGTFVIAADEGDGFCVWHALSGSVRLVGNKAHIDALALSDDGRLAAFAETDGKLQVWEVITASRVGQIGGADGNVKALAFSPDGSKLAAGHDSGTVLVWHAIGGSVVGGPALPGQLSAKDWDVLWDHLGHADAKVGCTAQQIFAAHPQKALELLSKRLEPEPLLLSLVVEQLLDQLGDLELKVRASATEKLLGLGHVIAPALRARLAATKNLGLALRIEDILRHLAWSKLSDEELRQVRAVAVVEQLGSPKTLKLLRTLADGDPLMHQTQASRQVLLRQENK
jgi:WD40 repeat protein